MHDRPPAPALICIPVAQAVQHQALPAVEAEPQIPLLPVNMPTMYSEAGTLHAMSGTCRMPPKERQCSGAAEGQNTLPCADTTRVRVPCMPTTARVGSVLMESSRTAKGDSLSMALLRTTQRHQGITSICLPLAGIPSTA